MQLARILVILAIALPFSSALAQTKLGFVDMQRVLSEIEEGKSMKARLESEAKKKRAELEKERNAILKDAETLEKQASAMSQEVQTQKAAELQKRQAEFLQKLQRSDQELAQKQNQQLGQILDKLNPIVAKVASREGLDLVVERAAVVYAEPSLDITNEVIRSFNSSSPKSDAPKKKK